MNYVLFQIAMAIINGMFAWTNQHLGNGDILVIIGIWACGFSCALACSGFMDWMDERKNLHHD